MPPKTPPVYAVAAAEGLFRVLRNARPLMTPKGSPYDLPREALAAAIVQEWQAQGEKIDTKTMPLTQLAATALDIVGPAREKTTEGLVAFVGTDLLCHWVESPAGLAERQACLWQPLLEWFSTRTGVTLRVTNGVMPAAPDPLAKATLRDVLGALDPFRLTGLQQATETAGSIVLGLALADCRLTARQVFDASELDVTYQGATWGDDPVTQGRQKGVLFDLEAAEKWFRLLG